MKNLEMTPREFLAPEGFLHRLDQPNCFDDEALEMFKFAKKVMFDIEERAGFPWMDNPPQKVQSSTPPKAAD